MDARPTMHPSDTTLKSFALGKLDDAALEAVNQHLETCEECRQQVVAASADTFHGRVRAAQGATSSTFGQSLLNAAQYKKATKPAPTVDSLPPGLAEHADYEVLKELGRGGMGVVYLAHNKLMGRDEVLKVMGRQIMERPGVLDRFLREIRAVAKLRHPNIVTAYSAFRLDESIVFAMEYVEGLDLSKLVKSKGQLPVAHACHFIHQAALGLQNAHENGLVHRDIKPHNLMLSRTGDRAVVKILDFGLAKATREEKVDTALTSAGQALGTPDFIAPEQILDAQSADIRADIYSLGGTLFYLLTGGPPFKANSLYDLYQAHISRNIDPLNLIRPEVPAELAALVGKMMAKEPKRRFQTPDEVARALAPFFRKGSAIAIPRPAAPIEAVAPPPIAAKSSAPAPPPVAAPVKEPETPWHSMIELKEKEPASPVPTPKPAPSHARRPSRFRLPVAIASALLGLAVVLAGVVLVIKLREGTLVIDEPPQGMAVTVDGDECRLSLDGKKAYVKVAPGGHDVSVRIHGVTVSAKKVMLRWGETQQFPIELSNPTTAAKEPPGRREAASPPADTSNTFAEGKGDGEGTTAVNASDAHETKPLGAQAGSTPFRGKRYKVFTNQMSWHEAKSFCEAKGGRLSVVKDAELNSVLLALIKNAGVENAWLGATDVVTEGKWVWVDGSPMQYSNWEKAGNQPNNGGGRGEHYLAILSRTNGTWCDQPDVSTVERPGIICEWDEAPAAETGFVPLFNGKDLTGWKHDRGESSRFRVENGQIAAYGAGDASKLSFLLSDMSFANFQIRFEFYLPKESNSGFAFRAVPGEEPSPLEVNLCNTSIQQGTTGSVRVRQHAANDRYVPPTRPPVLRGEPNWDEMEVEARGNIVRVSVNGVLVQTIDLGQYAKDSNVLAGVTRRAGRVGFQCHTGVVRFRNVRIKELVAPSNAPLAAPSAEKPATADANDNPDTSEFVSLFNGKDLTGWTFPHGNQADWSVTPDGMIRGKASGEYTTLATLRQNYGDFHLRMEIKRGLPRGPQFLVRAMLKPQNQGYYRFNSGGAGRRDGSIVNVGAFALEGAAVRLPKVDLVALTAPFAAPMSTNTWHTVEIIAIGNVLRMRVDGSEVSAFQDPMARLMSGQIALRLSRGQHVDIRKIEIEEPRTALQKGQPKARGSAAKSKKSNRPADAVPYGDNVVKVFPEHLSWHEAAKKCRALGGRLVIVRNEEQNRIVTALARNAGLQHVWLGATDELVEGRWLWVDGTPMAYQNWDRAARQPNNGYGGEQYLCMSVSRDGVWWDQGDVCNDGWRPGFICEWD